MAAARVFRNFACGDAVIQIKTFLIFAEQTGCEAHREF
jgi:hypothetical protein